MRPNRRPLPQTLTTHVGLCDRYTRRITFPIGVSFKADTDGVFGAWKDYTGPVTVTITADVVPPSRGNVVLIVGDPTKDATDRVNEALLSANVFALRTDAFTSPDSDSDLGTRRSDGNLRNLVRSNVACVSAASFVVLVESGSEDEVELLHNTFLAGLALSEGTGVVRFVGATYLRGPAQVLLPSFTNTDHLVAFLTAWRKDELTRRHGDTSAFATIEAMQRVLATLPPPADPAPMPNPLNLPAGSATYAMPRFVYGKTPGEKP